MKSITIQIDKIFDHRIRLGIMSILMVEDWVDFVSLREMLGNLPDGTLANHLTVLENAGYLEVRKQFVGRKPRTSYAATNKGRDAFSKHLDILEKLIKKLR